MARAAKAASVLVLTALLFISCATTVEKGRPYYDFQAMGRENVIVVTVDAEKEGQLVGLAFDGLDEFSRRAKRVSLSLAPTSDAYPLEPASLAYHGVVEGDYPRYLLNTGLTFSKEMQRMANENGLIWFQQKEGPLSLYTPKKDRLLFSNSSYEAGYAEFASRSRLIDDQTAALMAQSSIAVYVVHPETFFELGLGLTAEMVRKAKLLLLLINQDEEGKYLLDAYVTMDTEKLANTLSQVVRTAHIARLRKEKIPFRIADLQQLFLVENDRVTIKHMELGEEQISLLRQSLTGML